MASKKMGNTIKNREPYQIYWDEQTSLHCVLLYLCIHKITFKL